MKRLLASACLALAVITGTSLVPAQAAENGVGASQSDSTGQERACEAHAENKGKSVAKGLECAPPATLVVTLEVWEDMPDMCMAHITGTRLAPGTDVWLYVFDPPQVWNWLGWVDESGNFTGADIFFRNQPYEITASATTASGETITTKFMSNAC